VEEDGHLQREPEVAGVLFTWTKAGREKGEGMPSIAHEVIVQVLREEGVLADVLRRPNGLEAGKLVPSDPNESEVKPAEWHGDALFLEGNPKVPRRWVMVEVQVTVDPEKVRTIPLGLELVREWHRGVEGDVVVVTAGAEVARWFDRNPFLFVGPMGTTRLLSVVRLDLARVPLERLLDERFPALAVLAVAAHRRGPEAHQVATTAVEIARRGGTGNVPSPLGSALVDVVL
jgi:hypothetical protein